MTELFTRGSSQRDPVIADLLNYWEHLRAGRVAPMRSEIDPRQINTSLGHTFILEMDRVGGIRFRLAGIKVCDLLGMELRGMPARALIEPLYRETFDETLITMTEDPRKIEFRLSGQSHTQTNISARMVLLPMQGPEGEITRMLGGLSVQTPVFDPPMRFKIVEKISTRIVTSMNADAELAQAGFAETTASFEHGDSSRYTRGVQVPRRPAPHPPKAGPGASHLKLVYSR